MSSHAPETAPRPRAENEEDTYQAYARHGRGYKKSLGPWALITVSATSAGGVRHSDWLWLLFTKSYDVYEWDLDLFPTSRFCGFTLRCAHFTDPCAAVLMGFP